MSGISIHLAMGAFVLAVTAGRAELAQAQTRLPKPVIATPTVIVGPASLSATSDARAQVTLLWPAVTGATSYRLTRIDNTGTPEVTIEELPAGSFVFEGATCVAGSGQPNCVYSDMSRLSRGTRPAGNIRNPDASVISVAPSNYPHDVVSGTLYTYRAWAIFPGPIVSPPSPPATVQVK